MKIKQSVINTLKRIGINYESLMDSKEKVMVYNRFGGGSCETSPLIASLIDWVYDTNNDFDRGIYDVKVQDFDRIRYFVLEADSNAYMTCLD